MMLGCYGNIMIANRSSVLQVTIVANGTREVTDKFDFVEKRGA